MSPSMIRRKVEEEVAMVPDEKIAKLYDLVHHFRLRARPPVDAVESSRHRREIGRGGADRLDAGLLVIREISRRRGGRIASLLADQLHLAVDMEHFHHLAVELRVPALQVVVQLVGPQIAAVQDLGDGPSRKLSEARMPCFCAMLAGMSGQKLGGPKLGGVAQLFGLLAGQGAQPGSSLGEDLRRASTALQVVKGRQRPQLESFVDEALDLAPFPVSGRGRRCSRPRRTPAGSALARPAVAGRCGNG